MHSNIKILIIFAQIYAILSLIIENRDNERQSHLEKIYDDSNLLTKLKEEASNQNYKDRIGFARGPQSTKREWNVKQENIPYQYEDENISFKMADGTSKKIGRYIKKDGKFDMEKYNQFLETLKNVGEDGKIENRNDENIQYKWKSEEEKMENYQMEKSNLEKLNFENVKEMEMSDNLENLEGIENSETNENENLLINKNDKNGNIGEQKNEQFWGKDQQSLSQMGTNYGKKMQKKRKQRTMKMEFEDKMKVNWGGKIVNGNKNGRNEIKEGDEFGTNSIKLSGNKEEENIKNDGRILSIKSRLQMLGKNIKQKNAKYFAQTYNPLVGLDEKLFQFKS